MTRRLIVTADDFGMSLEVNEAVEAAHRDGILTCASLVVAGAAVGDAVRRAKRLPGLGVGLHLALYGAPAQVAGERSRIVPDGISLGDRPVTTGTAIMLSPTVRAAARREVAAQFDAYARTGLSLGHLDGHWHCHQHPAVLAMAIDLGLPRGLRAVRIPHETYRLSRRVAGTRRLARLAESVAHFPLAAAMRRQISAAGLRANDWFFGKTDAGSVGTALLANLVEHLPAGVTEIGLHPAVRPWSGAHAPPPDWRADDELAALTDPALRSLIGRAGVTLCRWSDLP